jgi:tetratricopeptide (TPR) repeat protein
VGKTTVAVEFVYRYGRFFAGGVFWLSFADPANIGTEIAQCGNAGGLQVRPDFPDLSLSEQVAAVRRAWDAETPRLLIFDNVDTDNDEALVAKYRPTMGGACVLITSRRGVWDAALGIAALPLDTLPRPESVALLQWFRATLPDADAAAVAAELGDLPLALHLAGSFLAQYTDLSAAEYIAELHSDAILNHESLQGVDLIFSPTNHDLHVARTFAASYRRLDASEPLDALALALLARAAHFAPGDPIPRDLLLATVDLPDSKAERQARRALRRLTTLGLLELDDDGTPTLHRLLARFVQQTSEDAGAQDAVETAVIHAADRHNTQTDIPSLSRLSPHLRYVCEQARTRHDAQTASLCGALGHYYWIRGEYDQSHSMLRAALDMREAIFGTDHILTAESLNKFGILLSDQGDYAAARPLLERALAIREQVLGAEHPETAISLNDLAAVLRAQGDEAAARPLFERALAIREQVLGPTHPSTAQSLNNLAAVLRAQGDEAAARPLFERALAICEQVLGPTHPHTAGSLNNLAMLLKAQVDEAAARPLYERALAINEQVLGPTHPRTAGSLNNLAMLLRDQGDDAAARPLFERALAINEQVLGPTHPDTAQSLNSLAMLLRDQGDYAAARPLLERALAICEQVLGPTHPDTAQSLNNLAAIMHAQGNAAAARRLLQRALATHEQVLGPSHPNTQGIRANLNILSGKKVNRSQLPAAFRGAPSQPQRKAYQKPGRNAPCPCGSGKKYKQCHLGREDEIMHLLVPGSQSSESAE